VKRIFGTSFVDYLPAAILFVLAAIYLVTGYTYEPEARAFPVTVGWAALLLAAVDIVARTDTAIGLSITRRFNPAAAPENAEKHAHYSLGKQVAAVAWAAGFVALFVTIGILYAVPLYVFASMRLRGKRPLWMCLLAAAGITLFIYLLFVQLLQIELYPGLLFAEV
jgi:hypothetical protein